MNDRANVMRGSVGGQVGATTSVTDVTIAAPNHRPCRVGVISSVRLVRDALTSALARSGDLTPGSAVARIEDIAASGGDDSTIILVDFSLLRSRAAVRAVQRLAPRAKIVAFAVGEVPSDIVACAEAGLAGFALDGDTLEDLLGTVRRVARDEWSVSPQAAAMLYRAVGARAADSDAHLQEHEGVTGAPPPREQLTAREDEVLELMGRGQSNKEIARRLHIEITTVKNHVHNILGKMGVMRRGQAAAKVRNAGAIRRGS
jgi:DNA-binding NarL/FixJ family response regulator